MNRAGKLLLLLLKKNTARKATKSDRHKSLNCPVVATTADKRKEVEMKRKRRSGMRRRGLAGWMLPLLRHPGDGGVKATGNILELWAAPAAD